MNIEFDYIAQGVGHGKYNVVRLSTAGEHALSYDGNPVTFHCINVASLVADMMADGHELDAMLHGEYWK